MTTQEELPPLPPIVGAPWLASTVERYARNYALRCIATLKAENVEWKRIADQAHAALAENKGALHWKSQAETLKAELADWHRVADSRSAEIIRLLRPALTPADARDAERYRWLRRRGDLQNTVLDQIQGLTERAMDRAIDAAIAAGKGQP